jgi:hypothetical protein
MNDNNDDVKEPQNIECFNAACRLVLASLYQSFPQPMVLDSSEFLAKLPAYCQKSWGPAYGDDNVVAATIRFLADEGFLRHTGDGAAQEAFFPNAVLTSKGFVVLNQSLASLKVPDKTVGQRLMENLSLGDVTQVVGTVLSFGLGKGS